MNDIWIQTRQKDMEKSLRLAINTHRHINYNRERRKMFLHWISSNPLQFAYTDLVKHNNSDKWSKWQHLSWYYLQDLLNIVTIARHHSIVPVEMGRLSTMGRSFHCISLIFIHYVWGDDSFVSIRTFLTYFLELFCRIKV